MKKKFLGISLIILLMLTAAVGCSKGISTQYNKALENTAEIEKLSQSIDFNISIDTSELNLSPEEQQMFSIYSQFSGSFILKHDIKNKLGQLEGFIDINGVSMEVKTFAKEDKLVIQLPMFGKYLVVDPQSLQGKNMTDTSKLQANLGDALLRLWAEAIKKQNIKDLGNKTLSINNIEVETTEFEFTLPNDSIKKLLSDMIEVIFEDEEMQKFAINSMKQKNTAPNQTEAEIKKEIANVLEDLKASLSDISIENLNYTGNLDKNSYLVQEEASFSLNSRVPEAGDLKIDSKFTVKRWDIGKTQTIEMPDLTSENSMTLDDLAGEQGLPLGDFPQ